MLKKTNVFLLCIILMLNFMTSLTVHADEIYEDEPYVEIVSSNTSTGTSDKPPKVEAGAAIIMDVKSGRVLYEKNAYTRKAMASTTKIMTAIVALENGNLDDIVTISKRAASIWGSTIHLREGQKLSLRELMYGLMLNSGNDAAIAIAEHIGGTVENFADMMTKKAEDLGAKDTSYKTPHGLDAQDHYTTAYDLALITRYALANPEFSKIVRTISTSISTGGLYNTNEMLGAYPGADGVKTGYTGKAGRCLVTSVTRDNWRIISVVLNCSSRNARARDSKNILDYTFENYKQTTLVRVGEEIRRIPVYKGMQKEVSIKAEEEVVLPLRKDEVDQMETQIELPDIMEAPVAAGVTMGSISYLVNGKVIAQTSLATAEDVRRKGILDYLADIIRAWGRLMSPNKADAG